MTKDYNPTPETVKWLTWLYDRIQTVPYDVTARWAFYRLVDEFKFVKKDYKKFLQIMSKARKRYYAEWTPTSFVDDTRAMMNTYGGNHESVTAWFDSMADRQPRLEFENKQKSIIFVCFEAKAMIRQFRYHLDGYRVCLVPFGGDPSIPFKYRLAKEIENMAEMYDKPIKVLYFGDFDRKGTQIPEDAMRDVREWSSVDFEFIRIGINEEHVEEFDLVDDPEHPGKIQWEALNEKTAEKLINQVFEHWDKEVIDNIKQTERKAGVIWSGAVESAIDEAKDALENEGESHESTEES